MNCFMAIFNFIYEYLHVNKIFDFFGVLSVFGMKNTF